MKRFSSTVRDAYVKARIAYARRRWNMPDPRAASMFDGGYYLHTYPDVRMAGIDPFEHFIVVGWKEGRNPCAGFDTKFYLDQNKDVAAAGMNPLLHYIRYGLREGRLPNRSALNRLLKRVVPSTNTRHQFDLDAFLVQSLCQPVTRAPFKEEHKRCFAVMENLAKRMAALGRSGPQPLVSIIMPAFNRSDLIGLAVQSVLDQSYENFELIVADDGSTDQTINVVRSFNDPRIHIIEHSSNTGSSATRNRAIEKSRGEFITFLDSDNRMHRDFCAALVGAFQSNKSADLIYCAQLLYSNDSETPYGLRFSSYNSSLLENVNYIDLNSVMHRRSLVEAGVRFDTSLSRLVDWDYILEISGRFNITSAPMILSLYYMGLAKNTITANGRYVEALAAARKKHVLRKEKIQKRETIRLFESVSIIIPSFEALDSLQECIESIKSTIHSDDYELIIVDNASSDPVRAFLKNIREPNIKIILNDYNFGFTHAINQGADASKPGRPIILLNNDAVVLPGAVQALQNCARSNDAVGIVVPQQILLAGEKTITTHVPGAASDNDCDVSISSHHGNVLPIRLFHDGQLLDLSFAPFFCVYIERATFDAIGGLDAEFGRHYRSDRTFCSLTRKLLGQRIIYTPDARLIHKHQVATAALKKSNKSDFDLMYAKNKWPKEQAELMGYRTADWDY